MDPEVSVLGGALSLSMVLQKRGEEVEWKTNRKGKGYQIDQKEKERKRKGKGKGNEERV